MESTLRNFVVSLLLISAVILSGCGSIPTSNNGSFTPSPVTPPPPPSPPPPPTSAGGFTGTGSMKTPRFSHAATSLQDGRVLMTGGEDTNQNALASAELFDPNTQSFALTGTLITARFQHTATLLNNGEVLLTGGDDGNGNALATAEVFDPSTGLFASVGQMHTPRIGQTATLLNDGRVLVAGGGTATAELFDPTTGRFTPTGGMTASRSFHAAVLLPSGEVFLAGGTDPGGTALGDLFDPASGTFTPTSTGGTLALNLTGTLLNDGRALLAGGVVTKVLSAGNRCCRSGPVSVTSVIVFDDSNQSFSGTTPMSASRAFHSATLLGDGKVLIAGGATVNSTLRGTTVFTSVVPLASAEQFDPVSGVFILTGNMTNARSKHTATLLGNGRVLVAGGIDDNNAVLATAELFH